MFRVYNTFEISSMLLEMVSNYNKYHEYYFSSHRNLWFNAPVVQYCIFRKNMFKRNKLKIYSKYIKNCAKFEHALKIKCKVSRKKLKAKKNLCWVPNLALDKDYLCRVSHFWHSAKGDGMYHRQPLPSVSLCRGSDTRQRPSLPRAGLCRVFGTRQRGSSPSVCLCRVPDFWHSAKHLTLGKALISCSGGLVSLQKVLIIFQDSLSHRILWYMLRALNINTRNN